MKKRLIGIINYAVFGIVAFVNTTLVSGGLLYLAKEGSISWVNNDVSYVSAVAISIIYGLVANKFLKNYRVD